MNNKIKILVLGQNGLIGNTVYQFLKKKKFNLITYNKRKEVFNLVHKANVIINCAGSNKINFYNANYLFLKKILTFIEKKKIHFIQISSLSIYGINYKKKNLLNKITENFPKNPTSAYGKSKLNAEKEILKYSKNKNFKYTILRIGSINSKHNNNRVVTLFRKIIKFNFFIYLNNNNTILNLLDLKKLNRVIHLIITTNLFYNKILNLCENITLQKFLKQNSKYNYFFSVNISNQYLIMYSIIFFSKIMRINKEKFNYLFLKNFYSNNKLDEILKKLKNKSK